MKDLAAKSKNFFFALHTEHRHTLRGFPYLAHEHLTSLEPLLLQHVAMHHVVMGVH